MKFHLPKKLMLAVLATLSIHTTLAGYYSVGEIFSVDEGAPMDAATISPSAVVPQATYAPFAKDGVGTAYIKETGTVNNALYVREGTLIVQGNKETPVRVELKPSTSGLHSDWDDDGPVVLSVGGKNSTMVVDGASVWSWTEAGTSIGGADGNGTLILVNGGQFESDNRCSFFVGMTRYYNETNDEAIGLDNNHATTKEVGADLTPENRFEGEYLDSVNKFGKGTINVNAGCTLNTGWGGFYAGEAEINVTGENAILLAGKYYASYVGDQNASETVINVKEAAEFKSGGSFYMGRGQDSVSRVNIDNASFTVTSGNSLWLGLGTKIDGTYRDNGSISTINVINGGKLQADNVIVSYSGAKSSIIIDAQSSAKGSGEMSILSNGTVTHSGRLDYSSITIYSGGVLEVEASTATIITDTLSGQEGGVLGLLNVQNSDKSIISGGLDIMAPEFETGQ